MKKFLLIAVALSVSATSASAQFTFSSLDFPGSTLTTGRGINNKGEIVGAYRLEPPRHAYLLKAGRFAPLAPSTVLGTNFSEAYKNNDRGDVVGYYQDDIGNNHGFLLRKGVLTTLDFPTASNTGAWGINESGTVVGSWSIVDSDGNLLAAHGFLAEGAKFTSLDYPRSANTTAWGINSAGQMVGNWFDSDGNTHGWVATPGNKGKPQ